MLLFLNGQHLNDHYNFLSRNRKILAERAIASSRITFDMKLARAHKVGLAKTGA